MTDLDKDTEAKILEIVKKYRKEENYQLNYLITDDNVITFFSSINIGKTITAEDLATIAEILNGEFIGFKIVNQEYRFSFNAAFSSLSFATDEGTLSKDVVKSVASFDKISCSVKRNSSALLPHRILTLTPPL